jgi:hypothetical protein
MPLPFNKIPSSQIRVRASFRLGDLNEEEPNLEIPRSFWHAQPVEITAWGLLAVVCLGVLGLCVIALDVPSLTLAALFHGQPADPTSASQVVASLLAACGAVIGLAVPLARHRRFKQLASVLTEANRHAEPPSEDTGELAAATDFSRGGKARPESSGFSMARPRIPK